jgi:hypothetical protein
MNQRLLVIILAIAMTVGGLAVYSQHYPVDPNTRVALRAS